MKFNFLIFILIYIFSINLNANERYICNNSNQGNIKLITNFYIIGKKLVMSGAIGNGEYKILNKSDNGILAINTSFIGEESTETILIHKKYNCLYRTFINRENNNISEVRGVCSLAN